jgi:hypothetical protein
LIMRRLLSAALLILLTACNTSKPQPTIPLPEWPQVPGGIVESLCRKLRQDALGENSALVLVKTTQPIANTQSLTALAAASQKRARGERNATMLTEQRAIPIEMVSGSCAWKGIDRLDPDKHADVMVVELSSPLRNPFEWHNVGLFARISLGGQMASWYWISIVPYGGGWVAADIRPLVM